MTAPERRRPSIERQWQAAIDSRRESLLGPPNRTLLERHQDRWLTEADRTGWTYILTDEGRAALELAVDDDDSTPIGWLVPPRGTLARAGAQLRAAGRRLGQAIRTELAQDLRRLAAWLDAGR